MTLLLYKKQFIIFYRITTDKFIFLRNQIIELFPNVDPDLFYIPYQENELNECTNARGCLYNYYKQVRGVLRIGKVLLDGDSSDLEKRASHCEKNIGKNIKKTI